MVRNKFCFERVVSSGNSDDTVFFEFNRLSSKKELLDAYYTQLKFPYFGFNWDALADCLGGLEWIEQRNIHLIHREMPLLPKKELLTYLEILDNTICLWNRPVRWDKIDPNMWDKVVEHRVKVYFPLKNKLEIEALCKELN